MRKHLHFIVVVSVLLVVMTWPTIVHVFDTDTFWLPSNNRDVWMKLWDAMHWKSVLAGKADYFYSDEMLFYPNGVSLAFHSLSLPHGACWRIASLMPVSNAYNLIYLLIVFSSTLAAYIYLLFLFNDKWLALFGAVVFGFSQHIISHGHHPDINCLRLATSLYFFHRGVSGERGSSVYHCGLAQESPSIRKHVILACPDNYHRHCHVLVCYIALETVSGFWLGIALMLCPAVATSFPRVQPLLLTRRNLDQALAKAAGRR